MSDWQLTRKKENLQKRARIVQTIRAFFMERDFLEVETPLRIPANAPEIHILAEPSDDWFLQTSPELCMKRLLAAGYPRVFQISRCFRRQERGSRHLPEFSMLEWYQSGSDYLDLMETCEELLRALSPADGIKRGGRTIDVSVPFERLRVEEAFARFASKPLARAVVDGSFDTHISLEIESNLGFGTPTFLYDYPASMAALSRKKPGNPQVAERFELYVAGLELANAFSELTDPVEQRRRFIEEEQARRAARLAPYPLPERFLEALETLPDCAGIALGIERLVMLLLGAEDIRDVVAFTPEDL